MVLAVAAASIGFGRALILTERVSADYSNESRDLAAAVIELHASDPGETSSPHPSGLTVRQWMDTPAAPIATVDPQARPTASGMRGWMDSSAVARARLATAADLARGRGEDIDVRAADLAGALAALRNRVAPRTAADAAEVYQEATRVWDTALALVNAYNERNDRLHHRTLTLVRGALLTVLGLVLVFSITALIIWRRINRHRLTIVRTMGAAVAEQAALRRTATRAAGETKPQVVFDAVVQEIRAVFPATCASVIRFDDDHQGRVVNSVGLPDEVLEVLEVRLTGLGIVAEVARGGRPVLRRDGVRPADFTCPSGALDATGTVSAIAAPMRLDGQLWGALVLVADGPNRFTPEDLPSLERFAEITGLAVSNAERLARLNDLALKDHLTGLANHRHFRERLSSEIERARRHGRDVAMALFDIDQFKLVNDALGHQGGDRALVDLAARLLDACRDGDLVARVGGEEFAWLMPETDSWGAWCAAERVRAAIDRSPLDGLERLTVSVGVCDISQSAWNGDHLYELADGALYWAKAHGRNLCVRYSPNVVVDLSADQRAARLEQRRTLDAVRLLAQAVDARDPNTQRHSERVAELAVELANEMGWSTTRLDLLREAALVHDVGKIGVPDSVLLKEGPLTAEERDRIQTHAALGAQMVSDVLTPEQVGWVRGHHERWDGAGYPDGVSEQQIPDGAQVLIVADAFDAMTGDRPYRKGRPLEDAFAEVVRGRGSQFPPDVVDAMTALFDSGRVPAILKAATNDADTPAA